MTLTAIILFIVLGVVLILLEFLVIPGTTIAGFGGIALLGLGVYFSYDLYGSDTGHWVLASAGGFMILALVISLRAKTWKKLMLNSSIDGQMNTLEEDIKAGDTGITISRLNPMGKIMIGNEYYEAKAINEIIDPNQEIIVVKVSGGSIIVKPK